jgi:hypothetical protein
MDLIIDIYYQRNTSIHCNFLNNNLDGPYSLVEPNEIY